MHTNVSFLSRNRVPGCHERGDGNQVWEWEENWVRSLQMHYYRRLDWGWFLMQFWRADSYGTFQCHTTLTTWLGRNNCHHRRQRAVSTAAALHGPSTAYVVETVRLPATGHKRTNGDCTTSYVLPKFLLGVQKWLPITPLHCAFNSINSTEFHQIWTRCSLFIAINLLTAHTVLEATLKLRSKLHRFDLPLSLLQSWLYNI